MAVKIAPSLLAADFSNIGQAIRNVKEAGADYLHFDVMDGKFVPNITMGPKMVSDARCHSNLFHDVHLMIEDPERYIEDFRKARADGLTIQAEAVNNLFRAVAAIHSAGLKAGVAICPGTPLSRVEEILPEIDLLLIMTVDPGFGGQHFIPSMLEKIRRAAAMVKNTGRPIEIEVDGGINKETAPQVIEAGATILVAGSAIFKAESTMSEAIAALRGER